MRRNRNRFKVLFGVAAVLCVLAAVCLLVSSRLMNTADSSAEETSQQTEEEPETTVEIDRVGTAAHTGENRVRKSAFLFHELFFDRS